MQNPEESSWQNLCLMDALKYLLTTGHLSDISICVGANEDHQRTFKCHKFVLACASPYFETMFFGNGNFVEKTQTEIKMTDVEPEDFKLFLDYVYSRTEIKNLDQFSIESLQSFVYMGNKFLQPKYSEFGVIAIENAIPKLRLVDLIVLFESVFSVGHERLISSVSKQLKEGIATTTTFNQPLANFDLSTFNEFIKCIESCVSEYTRFNWIEEYISQNYSFGENSKTEKNEAGENNKEGSLSKSEGQNVKSAGWTILLENICYVQMSAEEFSNGPLKSKLLQLEEKCRILADINKNLEKDYKTLELNCTLLKSVNSLTQASKICRFCHRQN